jgi:hypothetical protein
MLLTYYLRTHTQRENGKQTRACGPGLQASSDRSSAAYS